MCFSALAIFSCCSTSSTGSSHGLGRHARGHPLLASFWSWVCSRLMKLWDAATGLWSSASGWYGSIKACRGCASPAIISVFSIKSAAFCCHWVGPVTMTYGRVRRMILTSSVPIVCYNTRVSDLSQPMNPFQAKQESSHPRNWQSASPQRG